MSRLYIPVLERDPAMMLSTLMKDCQVYLASVEGYARSTLDNYDRTNRQFLAYLRAAGRRDELESFTDATCFGFMEDLGRRHVKVSTILNKLAALSSLAVYGMQARGKHDKPRLLTNPTKAFKWPTAEPPNIPILTPAEVRAYLEYPLRVDKAIIRDLFFDVGLRVSEIAEALVSSLLRVEDAWFIEVTVKSRGRRRRRQFPVSPDIAEHLQEYLNGRAPLSPEAPLVARRDRQPYSRTHIGQILARIGVAAGITRLRVSPHKIRHMVNVWGRLGGADPLSRSRLLGHVSTRSIDAYEHLIPHELHEARAKQREGMRRYLGENP